MGVDVLNVRALVTRAATVAVPAFRASGEPMWALLPLVEGARSPEAQPTRGGAQTCTVLILIQEDDCLLYSVQDLDDGFRQRRWLVERYAACWNAQAGQTDGMAFESSDEYLEHFRDELSEALRASASRSRMETPINLDDGLVTALARLKAVEAWLEAGTAEPVDVAMLREAVTADIHEIRPFGILNALSYDAVSPASETALWGYLQRPGGHRVANFSARDFFRWAADATGYNERYVRRALAEEESIWEILGSEGSTKGKRGSVFPEVLGVLRERGASLLRVRPVRSLWAQGAGGTTVDEPAPAGRVIHPASGKSPKRGA